MIQSLEHGRRTLCSLLFITSPFVCWFRFPGQVSSPERVNNIRDICLLSSRSLKATMFDLWSAEGIIAHLPDPSCTCTETCEAALSLSLSLSLYYLFNGRRITQHLHTFDGDERRNIDCVWFISLDWDPKHHKLIYVCKTWPHLRALLNRPNPYVNSDTLDWAFHALYHGCCLFCGQKMLSLDTTAYNIFVWWKCLDF